MKIPTLLDVQLYCKGRNNGIDAEAFLAHYTAIGWVYGKHKTPVKDWKSCVITWEKHNKSPQKSIIERMQDRSWAD